MTQKIKRGDIWLCDLPDTGENVQRGLRPVVVIQNNKGNFYSPLVIVVPLTSRAKKPMPTHCSVLTQGSYSIALCETILTINKRNLYRHIGRVSEPEMAQIDRCVKIELGLEVN